MLQMKLRSDATGDSLYMQYQWFNAVADEKQTKAKKKKNKNSKEDMKEKIVRDNKEFFYCAQISLDFFVLP